MAKQPPRPPGDYKIGKGKPPKQHQFAKGKSGNPGGRKKQSLNVKTLLMAIAESEIEITENGRKAKKTMAEALLLRHFQEALRGRPRSIEDLLDRMERYGSSSPEQEEEQPDEDRIILDRALSPHRRKRPDMSDEAWPDRPRAEPDGSDLAGLGPEASNDAGEGDDG